MDIATAIPVSVGIITISITGFKLISLVKSPEKQPKTSNNGGSTTCPLHSGIERSLEKGEERMDSICADVRIVREVVLELAAAQNIPVEKYKKLVT